MSDEAEIRFLRVFPAALGYHVLAHLDLGRDAASLFDPALPPKPWAEPLRDAYLTAPGRLAIQFAPLRAPSAEALASDLRGAVCWRHPTPADRRLGAMMADTLDAEAPALARAWVADELRGDRRRRRAAETLGDPLDELRRALWRLLDRGPPPLVVCDCPALRSHGRGLTIGGTRIVAVSLAERPIEKVLCQIFHEETHPVSDREQPAAPRSTRPEDAGYERHRELESRAVALGARIIDTVAPEYAAAYASWRRTFGV